MDPVIFEITDILDLHTFNPREVPDLIGNYLEVCAEKGIDSVRIIHGKGTGALKRRVQSILSRHRLVLTFKDAPPEAGGWGATLVQLKLEANMPGALTGIKILDLSRMLPGPYCSMILADHGARVIAVEDKRFQADGLFPPQVNRNKQHMTLNLKTVRGKAIFHRLLADTDVLIEGFRPGVTQRLGVDYETISKIKPGIIYCSITGYGQTGPLRDRAGHDVNYIAEAGVLDLVGEADRPPVIPGVQIADIAGGALNAAVGILMALYHREQTGHGQFIDISMTDGAAALLSLPMFFKKTTGVPFRRGDAILSHRYACYNVYETADGRFLSIGALENRFWESLCRFLEMPGYGPLQYDDGRRIEIIEAFRTVFRQKTLAQWEKALAPLDVCWAPVKTVDELADNPHFKDRQMVVDIPDKNGNIISGLGISIKLERTPGSIHTPPPAFGQDTAGILKELGYTDDDLKTFVENDIV